MKNFEKYIGMLANTLGLIGSVLSVLKKLPCWMLAGLALSGIIFLFIFPEDCEPFRILIKIWFVLFSSLLVAKIIAQLTEYYLKNREMKKDNQRLKLFFHESECWWILTKQHDGSHVSQISLKIWVHNFSDSPISLVKTRLIKDQKQKIVYRMLRHFCQSGQAFMTFMTVDTRRRHARRLEHQRTY